MLLAMASLPAFFTFLGLKVLKIVYFVLILHIHFAQTPRVLYKPQSQSIFSNFPFHAIFHTLRILTSSSRKVSFFFKVTLAPAVDLMIMVAEAYSTYNCLEATKMNCTILNADLKKVIIS